MRLWMSEIDAIDAGGVVGVVGEAGEASEAGDVGDSTVGVTGTWVGTRTTGTCKYKGSWIRVQWVVLCTRVADVR
ncbi:hypothetical protein JCGZ_03700 [Jatropha curcas]|uniref:Uncharacterized protein n=1 Tax=Jatropha curcas TaxID=180498 RepID=A0A067KWQ1_JATCU|nr:hypothetical protein JCGZ_03700 [Jatropha curcas]